MVVSPSRRVSPVRSPPPHGPRIGHAGRELKEFPAPAPSRAALELQVGEEVGPVVGV